MRFLKLFTCISIILIFSLCFTMPCFAEATAYVWSPLDNSTKETSSTINETNAEVSSNEETSNSANGTNTLSLESGSAILIEQTTGQVLYEHNIHKQLRPASVTKVMSILLIMEALDSGKINLTDKVPCSENAASMGGSQIWLDPRETLSVDEMLKAICVNSANDRSSCNERIHCWFRRSICSNDE